MIEPFFSYRMLSSSSHDTRRRGLSTIGTMLPRRCALEHSPDALNSNYTMDGGSERRDEVLIPQKSRRGSMEKSS